MRVLLFGVAMVALVFQSHGKTLYRNDFSDRTSHVKYAPPYSDWSRYDYQLGVVSYGYMNSSYTYTSDMPWADPSKIQDGWIRGAFGTYSASSSVRTNGVDATKRFLGFNLNSGSDAIYRGYSYQPIGNSFTNGLVEYYIDMRAPSTWQTPADGKTPYFRFVPAYRTYLRNPDGSSNPLDKYPLQCCLQRNGANNMSQILMVSGSKDDPPAQSGTGFNGWTAGHWYRFRATVNLDSRVTTMKVWDLGTSVPTWATEGRPVTSDGGAAQVSKVVYRMPTEESGPLDGIAFIVSGVNPKSDLAKMPLATNIRVSWKAPGADNFVPCYSNDFTSCWRRRLQAGSVAHAYSTEATGVCTKEFTSYVNEEQVVENAKGSDPSKTLQPVGVDGWRRASGWAKAKPVVTQGGGTTNVLMVTQLSSDDISTQTANLVQTLGRKYVLGAEAPVDRLIYSIDMRTPKKWGRTSNQYCDAYLGDELLYTKGCNDDVAAKGYVAYTTHRVASAGLKGKGVSKGDTYPYAVNESTAENVESINCPSGTWYRLVFSADLKAKTYDYTLWKLGTSTHYSSAATPSAKVHEMYGLEMRAGLTDIACFGFRAYATGSTKSQAILVDNLNVSTVVGTETNLIYRNLFHLSRRYDVPAQASLTDANNISAGERDNWVRRADPLGTLDLREQDGNAFAAVASTGDNPAFAVQTLAKPLKAKAEHVISVDIRPPKRWVKNPNNRCWAQLLLGDDEFAQADVYDTNAAPQAKAALRIGFTNGGNKTALLGQYTNVCATVRDGKGNKYFPFKVNASSWYRFVVKTKPVEKTLDVDIYEIGSELTKVGAATGLAYDPDASGDGLSALALIGVGMADQTPYDVASPDIALFDNLTIESEDDGLMVIMR